MMAIDETRPLSANPIFNANRLKLGIFGINGKGTSNTLVDEFHRPTWEANLKAAQLADSMGLEAIVPYSRWKGHEIGKLEHPSGVVLDPFTWAAGLGQATRHAAIFATSHAVTYHPLAAAKQCATIDIITGGRFGLNVVAGWNKPEIEMFGQPLMAHDWRYRYLAEWMDLVLRLWTEDEEFDHDGEFFRIIKGGSRPKPVQRPRPPIMNAASSEAGRAFAVANADMCFVQLASDEMEARCEQVQSYKRLAREAHGRDIQVWTMATVVERDTMDEARSYLRHYAVDHADEASIDAWLGTMLVNSEGMSRPEMADRRLRAAAGAGGSLLVGDADTIVGEMEALSQAGLDGLLLSWVNFEDGLTRLARDVLPRLEAKGLRQPFRPAS
ncbi:MAG: LLM class flavin-dependent oxidoreductase [Hyphomicrobiaceae bacterium]